MTVGRLVRGIPERLGRKRLTFEEVVASQRPAVFRDFGDSLLHLDGEVFILRGVDLRADSADSPPVLDARSMVHAVGIETGWQHAKGCDCSLCFVAAT